MEPNRPDTLVHAVQPMARGAVVHAQRIDTRVDDAARRDTPQVGPFVTAEDPVRYENIGRDADGAFVTGGRVAGHRVDSPEALEIVKNINTKTDLTINRWSEIASYMRWGTLGLMASSFTWLSVHLGIGAGAVAGSAAVAAALPAAIGFGIAAVVVGAATLLTTHYVRKLQSNRFMDVQGFMQERAATKIGKEVAQQLAHVPQQQRSDGKRWQDAVSVDQGQGAEVAR